MARIRGSKSAGNGGMNPTQKRHQRKRGYPDADAVIIELTPKDLMDDRMFGCMLCTSVFFREQNLILHLRTHSIPSTLKKNGDGRRKYAFTCPVPTCRHHDPKRALSDITGIKKHFGRAHGQKKWLCTHCPKAYGVEADLKAHVKLQHRDSGYKTSRSAVSSDARPEEHVSSDDSVEGAAVAVAAAATAFNRNGNTTTDKDDITFSIGMGEQREVYVPQFDVAPVPEKREQGRAATNESALLDMDLGLIGSLPMGLMGLLTVRSAHPEVPKVAADSAPLGALFPPAAAPPSAGGPGAVESPRESVLPTIDLNLPISSFETHHGSNAGAGKLQSLSFPAVEKQYSTTQAPASGQKESPAAGVVQGADMMGQNASAMTPAAAFLSNAAGLQMPHLATIPSADKYNYYFPESVVGQRAAMNTPDPFSFSSFAPFFGGPLLVNTNDPSMGGGFSDGLFAGYADPNQGRDLVSNGAGGFFLGTPSAIAPQQKPVAAGHGFSYPFMPGANGVGAGAAASTMNQPWSGLQMGYAAPPALAPGLANQRSHGSGYGARMELDLNF